MLEIRPNQTKPYKKPKPTYSLTYYDPSMIISHVQMKAKTLTHLQTLFLLPHVQMKLESQDPNSLRSSLPPYMLLFRYTHSSTSLQTTVCSLNSMIPSDQTNVPTHFSSFNLALLCKLMEIYSQGRYTITLKKIKKKEKRKCTV